MRMAYHILEMPPHRVYPALQIKPVFYLVPLVRIAYDCLDIILNMIVVYGLTEYATT